MITKYNLFEASRSTPIEIDYVKHVLSQYNFNNCKNKVYRGSAGSGSPYSIIKPSEHVRKSANTLNYYTLWIDNSTDWSNYPKRSKSIICSTNYIKASGYASSVSEIHIVVPVNKNAIFGICPERDIWLSFPKFQNNLLTNEQFKHIISVIGVDNWDTINYQDLQSLHAVNIFLEKIGTPDTDFATMVTHLKKAGLYDWYMENMNPTDNDFQFMTFEELMQADLEKVEVWTDADCLYVNYKKFEKLTNANA